MKNIQRICSNKNCNNPVFKGLDRCSLHCKKGKYVDDKHSGLLEDFYELLKKYILTNKSLGNPKILDMQKDDDDKLSSIRTHNTLNIEIHFRNIYFPHYDFRDSFNFVTLINIFKNINFIDCHIYFDSTNSFLSIYNGNHHQDFKKIFFDSCIFHSDFTVYPFEYLENDSKSLFFDCIFKNKVEFKKYNELNCFDGNIFCGGIFYKEVSLNEITLNSRIFNQDIDNKIHFKDSLVISKCNFEKKITLNNLKIKKLSIENSVFKDKLEIKDGNFEEFEFKNSNVLKVFTAQNSKFVKFSMRESIFEDFAGFEKVHFGAINDEDEKLISDFTYTTFKSFSNFREAVFHSGLDLSRINLKEQPNFFKVNIKDVNVNRETYRIIKNSFDKNGNHIVANDYFIMEMKAYRKELKKEIDIKETLNVIKCEFLKIKNLEKIKNFILIFNKILSEIYNNNKIYKKIVIDLNDAISGFGDNYIRPIRILILSIILYNLCFLMQKYYAFDESDGIIFHIIDFLNQSSKSFLIFSNFLKGRQGIEFVSLLFYIWFSVLIWQIVVAIKRHTIR